MTEIEWYDRTEELLREAPSSYWEQISLLAANTYSEVTGGERSHKEVKDILHGLIQKLSGFPPAWLVIAGPDGEIDTPDDVWIEPAYNPVEIQKAWNLHDGRNLGTMVVAVYRWDPDSLSWRRDTTYGMLGDARKTRKADPDDPDDELCS
jgi:hypothetical protein